MIKNEGGGGDLSKVRDVTIRLFVENVFWLVHPVFDLISIAFSGFNLVSNR